MLFVGLGNADRRLGREHTAAVVRLRPLDAPLNLAHVVQVLVEPRAIAGAEPLAQPLRLAGDEVQDAAVAPDPGRALRRGAGLAEQALEHDARVDLHRQRRCWRAPRDRVGVGAAVAGGARADVAREVFGGQLQRGKRRVLSDLPRHDLIDRDARQDVFGLGALGANAGEPAGRAHRVVTARRRRPDEIRDHHEASRNGSSGFRIGESVQARSGARRGPRFHDGAVGNEDGAEPRARRRRRLREGGKRRHHRIEQRQRHGGADPAKEGATRQRLPALRTSVSPRGVVAMASALCHFHLKRPALDDGQHDGREAIIMAGGFPHDAANDRHVAGRSVPGRARR